ncbi:MAG: ABC transporter substrate-binding protein [Bacillota bacterium]
MLIKNKCLLVLFLLLVAGFIVGCQGDGEQADNGGSDLEVAYYALFNAPVSNWDPAVELSTGIVTHSNIYETLLHYNSETMELEPLLATEVTANEDGTVWRFKLREGVTFHDGTPFTAEAVKYSIERTVDIGQGAAYIWEPVESINVIDDYTVEFVCKYPAAVNLISAASYGAFMISPSIDEQGDDYFANGNACGTGPYMLESSNMNDDVVLTRYEDYWKGWGDNHFDKVIIKEYTEVSARRQLIEQGEVDVTNMLASEDIDALKNVDTVTVDVYKSFVSLLMHFNTLKEPFDDVRVRQALAYCIPFQDIIDYAVGGYATQTYGAIPEGIWGYSDELSQYYLDLEKATQLFDEAGVDPSSLELLLTYTSGSEAERKVAELFKAELSKLGIELEIRALPWESHVELAYADNIDERQDIFIMYWWPDIVTPNSWYEPLFYTQDPPILNLSYYSNPKMDALIDRAKEATAVDLDAAADIFNEAQELFIEDCPSVFIYDEELVWVTSTTFKGHVDNPAYPHVVYFYNTYRDY